MTARRQTWTIRLAAAAQADIAHIVPSTAEHFGERQARIYAKTISEAVQALSAGPSIPGALARPENGDGLFTLHVARSRKKGRHFILFRVGGHDAAQVVEVLRVLHDAMDLPGHVPAPD